MGPFLQSCIPLSKPHVNESLVNVIVVYTHILGDIVIIGIRSYGLGGAL